MTEADPQRMTGGDTGCPDTVGYKRPPASTRFRKGQSGNPRGRPRGRRTDIPHDAVLGQRLTVRDGGMERTVTAAEAFLLYLTKRAMDGDTGAARLVREGLGATEKLRGSKDTVWCIQWVMVSPGSPNRAMERLKMATKLDRLRPTARMALEPWVVEAALARLGDRRLTRDEQAIVVKAARTPHKVRWPDWWEAI